MNPTKKSPGAKGLAKPVSRQQSQSKLIQRKAANSAVNSKVPVAPPVYRPQPVPKVLQRKASPVEAKRTAQTPHQPVAPPVYRPVTKRTVQPKAVSPARSVVQRQLPPGDYKVVSYSTLRTEGTYKEIDQIRIDSPVRVLDKGSRVSNFKAGWVTNEHSWVEVKERHLMNGRRSDETVNGWVNDQRLRSAPAPKAKGRPVVSAIAVEEEDDDAFRAQVNRLSGHFNKGMPPGLQVTQWLRQLGGNMAGVQPGTLAYVMCEDRQKSNGLFIIDDGHAILEEKNWAKIIIEDIDYRRQYPQAVRDFLNEAPCPVPRKYAASTREQLW